LKHQKLTISVSIFIIWSMSLSGLVPVQNAQGFISLDASRSTYLTYLGYDYFELNAMDATYDIAWSFSGSIIKPAAYAMTYNDFASFVDTYNIPATATVLNAGGLVFSASGNFIPTSSGTWIILFRHNQSGVGGGYVTIAATATQNLPYIQSHTLTTLNNNADVNNLVDSVRITFDPNIGGGRTATATFTAYLYDSDDNYSGLSSSGSFTFTGTQVNSFQLTVGYVTESDDYYIKLYMTYNGATTLQLTTIANRLWELASHPFVASAVVEPYSFDGDASSDSAKFAINVDFNTGYSGIVAIYAGLYRTGGTFIRGVGFTDYTFTGTTTADLVRVDLGSVTTTSTYYIYYQIIWNNGVVSATFNTPTFSLNAVQPAAPFLQSLTTTLYDEDTDGNNDGVRANFNPDFNGMYSGTATVTITLSLWNGASWVTQNTQSSSFTFSQQTVDAFQIDMGTATTTGSHRLSGYVTFSGTNSATVSTASFTLNAYIPPSPYIASLTTTTYDFDTDGNIDSVKANVNPDFNLAYSGTVTIIASLYTSTGTLVTSQTRSYSTTGQATTVYTIDLGYVYTTGLYYVQAQLKYLNVLKDTKTSTNFNLNAYVPPPVFRSVSHSTSDADGDLNVDTLQINVDADFTPGYSDSVTIFVEFYRPDNSLRNNVSQVVVVNGQAVSPVSFNLGGADVSGLHKYHAKIYYLGVLYSHAIVSIDLDKVKAPPTLTVNGVYLYDTDNDQNNDSVNILFDVDYEPGYTTQVTVSINLYSDLGDLLQSFNVILTIYGNMVDIFNETVSIAPGQGDYYITVALYHLGSLIDEQTTANFFLNSLYEEPYFYDYYYDLTDNDDNGQNDGVIVYFDVDYPDGIIDDVMIIAELYLGMNDLISTISGNFTINGTEALLNELNFGFVTVTGGYFIKLHLYKGDNIIESVFTSTFTLYAYEEAPILDRINVNPYQSIGGNTIDSVSISISPYFNMISEGLVTIKVFLYHQTSGTIINSNTDQQTITDTAITISYDLGKTTRDGQHYVLVELFYLSTTNPDVSLTSSIFNLELGQSSNPSSSSRNQISQDVTDEGTNLNYPSFWVFILSFGVFVLVKKSLINKIRKN